MVEISSVCQKIAIDRANIEDINKVEKESQKNPEFSDLGRTQYDGGKTPMQYNTPSYYPHSPHGWGAATPAAGGTDCNKNYSLTLLDGAMSPGMSRQGSEYLPNTGGNSRSQMSNTAFLKKEQTLYH